jgi:hypothetical protein
MSVGLPLPPRHPLQPEGGKDVVEILLRVFLRAHRPYELNGPDAPAVLLESDDFDQFAARTDLPYQSGTGPVRCDDECVSVIRRTKER